MEIMQSELLPHVDQDNNLLGLVDRTEAYTKGLPHRSVHALIRNSAGQYLLQQRSHDKATWPDKWDLSAGETLRGTETFLAGLRRGVEEELGITLNEEPEVLRDRYYCEYEWSPYKVYGIITLFRFAYDGQIVLTDGEVQATRWATPAEITQLIETQPESCTPWLLADWQWCVGEGKV
jgi:isopentenyl-diphosphate Delta-isomerase